MKTFTFAGTSVKNGETKVRWANDAKRVTAMEKDGQTNIVLVELPVAMNKLHATKFIGTLPEFQAAEQQTAIADFIAANDDGTELVIEFQEEEHSVDAVEEQAVVEEA
jgi:DNA gyrase/topoisomerase IV subunit A